MKSIRDLEAKGILYLCGLCFFFISCTSREQLVKNEIFLAPDEMRQQASTDDVWRADKISLQAIKFGTYEAKFLVHRALFNIFYPSQFLKRPRIFEFEKDRIEEKIWNYISHDRELDNVYTVLSNLRLFEEKNLVTGLLHDHLGKSESAEPAALIQSLIDHGFIFSTKKNSSGPSMRKTLPGPWNIDVSAREVLLHLLARAPGNFWPRVMRKIRNIYLYEIYSGAIGKVLSLSPRTKKDHEQTNSQPRPKCHLRYDLDKHELVGALDFIIVGGSSSGSLLAYLLWAQGKKVLLLNEGPLLVPDAKDSIMNPAYFSDLESFDSQGMIQFLDSNIVGGDSWTGVSHAMSPSGPEFSSFFSYWNLLSHLPDHSLEPKYLNKTLQELNDITMARKILPDDIKKRHKFLDSAADGENLLSVTPDTFRSYQEDQDRIWDATGNLVKKILHKGILDYKNSLCVLPNIKVLKILRAHYTSIGMIDGVEIIKPAKKNSLFRSNSKDNWMVPMSQDIPSDTATVVHAKIVVLTDNNKKIFHLLHDLKIKRSYGKGLSYYPAWPLMAEFKSPISSKLQGWPLKFYTGSIFLGPQESNSLERKQNFFVQEFPLTTPMLAILSPWPASKSFDLAFRSKYIMGIMVGLLEEEQKNTWAKDQFYYDSLQSDWKVLKKALIRGADLLFRAGAKTVFFPQLDAFTKSTASSSGEFKAMLNTFTPHPYQNWLLSFAPMGGSNLGKRGPDSLLRKNLEFFEMKNLFLLNESVLMHGMGPFPQLWMQYLTYTFAKEFE